MKTIAENPGARVSDENSKILHFKASNSFHITLNYNYKLNNKLLWYFHFFNGFIQIIYFNMQLLPCALLWPLHTSPLHYLSTLTRGDANSKTTRGDEKNALNISNNAQQLSSF